MIKYTYKFNLGEFCSINQTLLASRINMKMSYFTHIRFVTSMTANYLGQILANLNQKRIKEKKRSQQTI